MNILKMLTWLKIERDFKLTGFIEKKNLKEKYSKLYSLLKFRMGQNEDLFEIFLGIRDFDGTYKAVFEKKS